jgi:hypothetical protein
MLFTTLAQSLSKFLFLYFLNKTKSTKSQNFPRVQVDTFPTVFRQKGCGKSNNKGKYQLHVKHLQTLKSNQTTPPQNTGSRNRFLSPR